MNQTTRAPTDMSELDIALIGTRTTDREVEIEVDTDWRGYLDTQVSSLSAQQFEDKEVWLVENVFSVEECLKLLAASEEKGFGRTSYPKNYRGNLRLLATDDQLADAVWQRLLPVVPETLSLDGETWEACGLNEVWRCAKYHPNDQFQGHCDASYQRNNDEMSMLTANIYMNGDF